MLIRLIIIFIVIPVVSFGEKYKISVELPKAAGEEVFLARYYLDDIYSVDTLLLDAKGKGVFSADSILPQGLYKLYLNRDNHFDFLIGADQKFSLSNRTFNPDSVEVYGADETKAFIEYVKFLRGQQRKKEVIELSLPTATGNKKRKLRQDYDLLTSELHTYWDSLAEVMPQSFLAKFVKANFIPDLTVDNLPEEVQQNDTLLYIARFYQHQKHFWDNLDYTDERFLYTPFIKSRLETWFTKVLFQHYDSVKGPVFNIIEEVKPNRKIFQFMTSWFLNNSLSSQVMGMDELFVDIAYRYYLSGEAFWVSEESLQKIQNNLMFVEHNLIGREAADLVLNKPDGEVFTLSEHHAEFTLIILYEPDCGYCREFVPKLYEEVFLPFKDRGVTAVALYSSDNREVWEKFINENKLFDWINVWDENRTSSFRIFYDARMIPKLYILDKDKKIIAKKLSIEQAKEFLSALLD